MTDVLAVAALAVLAVVFGLVYRHRGCGGCAAPGGSCGACPRADRDAPESDHV